MNKIDFLIDQLAEVRSFVNRLLGEVPNDLWYAIPQGTDSNIAWQVGHLLLSQNFHAIACISVMNRRVYELVPVVDYVKIFYGMGSLHRSAEKDLILVLRLKEQLNGVHEICIEGLLSLNDDVLCEPLERISFRHPVADCKYDALSWCFKHEMWHCAEIEAIKRELGYPIQWMR